MPTSVPNLQERYVTMVLNFIKKGFLTSNMLKVIAMVTMLIDHMGSRLFDNSTPMRLIGRLAMPIFAYLIAEGCHYTKNKTRHFLEVFLLGVFCQASYMLVGGGLYLNILLTFSVSIGLIYTVDLAMKNRRFIPLAVAALLLLYPALVVMAKLGISFDYGFFGIILPLFAFIPKGKWMKFLCFTVGVFLLGHKYGGLQLYGMLALIPIAFYNGERGKFKFKYAFYLFYPLHLFAIFIIKNIIEALS